MSAEWSRLVEFSIPRGILEVLRYWANGLLKRGSECGGNDKAIEIKSDDAQSWNNKGVAFYELGKYEEAMECYDNALKINPNIPLAKQNKNIALQKSKKKKGWFR